MLPFEFNTQCSNNSIWYKCLCQAYPSAPRNNIVLRNGTEMWLCPCACTIKQRINTCISTQKYTVNLLQLLLKKVVIPLALCFSSPIKTTALSETHVKERVLSVSNYEALIDKTMSFLFALIKWSTCTSIHNYQCLHSPPESSVSFEYAFQVNRS